MAVTPDPLREGSHLAAVSPAGPVGKGEVERGVQTLSTLGFRVTPLPNALAEREYLAGKDTDRAADLTDAFCDEQFDGVICTRGGYGSMRLLPLLDFDLLAKHPKPFIGFSDITALQTALWQRLGWVTFSGPQLARGFGGEKLDGWSKEQFRKTLTGEAWGQPLDLPDGVQLRPTQEGTAEGVLLGGNLAILASLCGTHYQPRFDGAVVILEETDEPPYRIDRMLTQLLQAGAFRGVRGILLGDFTQRIKGEPQDRSGTAETLLAEALPGVPILANAPYGHIGTLWTLPLGAHATLDTSRRTLTVEPA